MKPPAWVWLNGRLVRASSARISVFDRGFLYGDAIFETVRIYAGQPFLWGRHRRRLAQSLRLLGLASPRTDLRTAMQELTAACRLTEAAVRITVTRGVGEGLLPPSDLEPTLLLTARSIPEELPGVRTEGASVIRLPYGRGGESIVTGHKTTGYATAVQGRIEADIAKAFEAIYVETNGNISEATTSNVFAVLRNTLYTPPLDAGCLPGITRELVLELAASSGHSVCEQPLPAKMLDRADEIFLTGSVIEILPVRELDGRRVAKGVPGPITQTLAKLYAQRVRRHQSRAR